MAWLLFMDESGHASNSTPMEVRGGIAIESEIIWDFLQSLHQAEKKYFGVKLTDYNRLEIKGKDLLSESKYKRIRTASEDIHSTYRHVKIKDMLNGKHDGDSKIIFAEACWHMAKEIFYLLKQHNAYIFATLVPGPPKPPEGFKESDFLRGDYIALQQAFYTFLKEKDETGILILDKTDNRTDKHFIKCMQNYYTKHEKGKNMTDKIVPLPLFIDSELSPFIQVADVCVYCLNWGYRHPSWSGTYTKRDEIYDNFGALCKHLQFESDGIEQEKIYSIRLIEDPYIDFKKREGYY